MTRPAPQGGESVNVERTCSREQRRRCAGHSARLSFSFPSPSPFFFFPPSSLKILDFLFVTPAGIGGRLDGKTFLPFSPPSFLQVFFFFFSFLSHSLNQPTMRREALTFCPFSILPSQRVGSLIFVPQEKRNTLKERKSGNSFHPHALGIVMAKQFLLRC